MRQRRLHVDVDAPVADSPSKSPIRVADGAMGSTGGGERRRTPSITSPSSALLPHRPVTQHGRPRGPSPRVGGAMTRPHTSAGRGDKPAFPRSELWNWDTSKFEDEAADEVMAALPGSPLALFASSPHARTHRRETHSGRSDELVDLFDPRVVAAEAADTGGRLTGTSCFRQGGRLKLKKKRLRGDRDTSPSAAFSYSLSPRAFTHRDSHASSMHGSLHAAGRRQSSLASPSASFVSNGRASVSSETAAATIWNAGQPPSAVAAADMKATRELRRKHRRKRRPSVLSAVKRQRQMLSAAAEAASASSRFGDTASMASVREEAEEEDGTAVAAAADDSRAEPEDDATADVDVETLLEEPLMADSHYYGHDLPKQEFYRFFRELAAAKRSASCSAESAGEAFLQALEGSMLTPEPLAARMHEHQLNLRAFGVGEKYLPALASAAEHAGLKELLLASNRIRDGGMKPLADAIGRQCALAVLDLSFNSIGRRGAALLQEPLTLAENLMELNLEGNRLGNLGAASLAAALKGNTVLTKLNLSRNSIGLAGLSALCAMLEVNHSLLDVQLAWNEIRGTRAPALQRALTLNNGLEVLNLAYNCVGGLMTPLCAGLVPNRHLTHLDISHNNVPRSGLKQLEAALKENTVLMGIHLKGNQFQRPAPPLLPVPPPPSALRHGSSKRKGKRGRKGKHGGRRGKPAAAAAAAAAAKAKAKAKAKRKVVGAAALRASRAAARAAARAKAEAEAAERAEASWSFLGQPQSVSGIYTRFIGYPDVDNCELWTPAPVCWICEQWVEHTFVFQPDADLITPSASDKPPVIELRLSCSSWRTEMMKKYGEAHAGAPASEAASEAAAVRDGSSGRTDDGHATDSAHDLLSVSTAEREAAIASAVPLPPGKRPTYFYGMTRGGSAKVYDSSTGRKGAEASIKQAGDDRRVLTKIVPPGRLDYVFRVDGVEQVARSQPVRRHSDGDMLPFTMHGGAMVNSVEIKPRTGRIRKATTPRAAKHEDWSVKASVFRYFRNDTKDLLRRCFEADWALVHLTRTMRSVDDLLEVERTLQRYYAVVKNVFKYHAAQSTRDVFSLGWIQFTEVMHTFGILAEGKSTSPRSSADASTQSGLTLTQLDNLFIATNKNKKVLTRAQFMEALVRVALQLFYRTGDCSSPARAVKRLFESSILPNSQHFLPEEFRLHRLYVQDVDTLLRGQARQLKALFREYSTKPKSGMRFMTFAQFWDLVDDAGLVTDEFTPRHANVAFTMSQATEVEESSVGIGHAIMDYVEFLECLGRIADMHPLFNNYALGELDKPSRPESTRLMLGDVWAPGSWRDNWRKGDDRADTPTSMASTDDGTAASSSASAAASVADSVTAGSEGKQEHAPRSSSAAVDGMTVDEVRAAAAAAAAALGDDSSASASAGGTGRRTSRRGSRRGSRRSSRRSSRRGSRRGSRHGSRRISISPPVGRRSASPRHGDGIVKQTLDGSEPLAVRLQRLLSHLMRVVLNVHASDRRQHGRRKYATMGPSGLDDWQ
eukprot:PLAT16134.1.p1 GENE.PLAT16134.1~~PLAT16134.1.p1  ORF type:complete len:1516 (-),score=565.96 PLAT16134.1:1686-6233(-)